MAHIKKAQHNLKLANVLNNMLQCGSLVDVTIYCDDGQVSAHKLVLAASSTYFRNLFSRMTNAFHYPIIVLREMPVNDLKTIMQFIYHGEVNVPQNRVNSLMRWANYLEIDGMASSANSLNAILASSSSMSHHALLSAHAAVAPVVSANLNNQSSTLNNSTLTLATPLSKLHPQYPPQPPLSNCKSQSSRGHSSRTNNNNNSTSNLSASNTDNNTSNSNGKPKHTCPNCFKTFTHGFTLKRHMKLHSQVRNTIFCEVCSKSYSCKDSFLRHKKSSGHQQHADFHHRSIGLNLGPES